MAFLLGHGSAVEWLRLNRNHELLNMRYDIPYASLEGSRRQFERHALEALDPLTRPIQLVVWNRESRRRTALTHCRVFNVPSGKYTSIRIKRMLFCSVPEFAFVQMANLLDEERLRFLGMELCGRFGIDGRVFLRPQTVTSQMLFEQAKGLPRVHGRAKAIAIAPLVIAGAASPMEIALTLMLCAERKDGGYGLPAPELNRQIPVTGNVRPLWYDNHITPDLVWEQQKLVVEYDSELHHTAQSRIANDALRRNVLQELGYRVITVTSQHLRTPRQIEQIARSVARQLGVPFELGDERERTSRAAYQARMYHLGAHPEELLAIEPHETHAQRDWHARR